jgi:PhzF family phenazine biosynthesis protein
MFRKTPLKTDMHSRRFKQVDVFTQKPFFGNPVAVLIDAQGLNTEEMQRIARWTNLSETTFVFPPSAKEADYRLRIFSPKQELPFAGHPSLGSAHAIIESGFVAPRNGRLRQECLAGLVDLFAEETAIGKRIFLKTPEAKISPLQEEYAGLMQTALGLVQPFTCPPARVDVGVVWLVAQLETGKAVAVLQPELDTILKLSIASNAAGITVFGNSDDGVSGLHVRSFAPALGIAEDPVCGSGNASVGAFLVHTGKKRFGDEFIGRQGMQVGRDGQVWVRLENNAVQIGGYAITCVDGNLRTE